MTYQDPDIQLEIGNPNQDSVKLEEFTFHHGHVHQVINLMYMTMMKSKLFEFY